jgi:hypothetical protein
VYDGILGSSELSLVMLYRTIARKDTKISDTPYTYNVTFVKSGIKQETSGWRPDGKDQFCLSAPSIFSIKSSL